MVLFGRSCLFEWLPCLNFLFPQSFGRWPLMRSAFLLYISFYLDTSETLRIQISQTLPACLFFISSPASPSVGWLSGASHCNFLSPGELCLSGVSPPDWRRSIDGCRVEFMHCVCVCEMYDAATSCGLSSNGLEVHLSCLQKCPVSTQQRNIQNKERCPQLPTDLKPTLPQ